MTVIAQDDHLTAGAWAACEQRCVKWLSVMSNGAAYTQMV